MAKDDGLEIEHGIRAQWLKLLRIIAGLLTVVTFVSLVPFSCECRRWVREMVFSVLSRAECAAHHLVIAQARLMAGQQGLSVDPERLFHAAATRRSPVAALPTVRGLWVRLRALRALLLDLPRHGDRLLRRALRRLSEQPKTRGFTPIEPPMLRVWRLAAVRVERPPDRRLRL